jgi:hypothetical protein
VGEGNHPKTQENSSLFPQLKNKTKGTEKEKRRQVSGTQSIDAVRRGGTKTYFQGDGA